MFEREQEDAEQTTYEAVSHLADANKELDRQTSYENLIEFPDINSNLEKDSQEKSSYVSEFGQVNLSLYVYDLQEKLVFRTSQVELDLQSQNAQGPTLTRNKGQPAFLLVQPVYSKETREKIGYAQAFYNISSFYDIRNHLLLTLIVLEILFLVVSSILGYLLSAHFLKPLKTLRNTMENIQKDPQTTIHAPEPKSKDELADLSDIFNDMLDRMRSYTEQQEQFVEDVSHELRTPVAVIEGHLKMLQRWGKEDPEVLEESIEASLQEIARMKTLVQEMLDLSRAEQVDIYYKNETSSAKEVVYQVFNNFKMLYPEFMFTIDDDLNEEETVKIYRDHFEQILIIIMDNAIKYSTQRKEIHLSISRNQTELELAIQDFGEGITQENLNKIFHRFYRVDKARARDKDGNGLGLSIVKKLLDNYKGTIVAESSLGQGTVFRISLPLV
ncbi:HAMP domain-containing histidine kinase [Tetragenococcus halophilus]|uniref:Signal transduction histidine-protein kinase ArlS n=2 Tax=Tetragenococcus halophilus TaxID=51669 RepID=A0A2H6CRQ8_TETHA|nr:HAMP domain-containing histidine kinase [Tetragenococcus halophilus]GBD67672.1 two-component histidine kinase [Tetragenococcus halophilus subsp. halophilus]MDN6143687.1 HAMP domain-containing histidine kinase [Tetragenococcus halophilus]GEQ47245.1 two-component system sensor histidine kinase [Tetragenococcus halophilus]GMG64245.1 HAMP domain-containing histidine kinase [Tetragenococcus halophilus]GMG65396.1 HAMP domain-containing histidine kinase [Tetragenococcus halophilus]